MITTIKMQQQLQPFVLFCVCLEYATEWLGYLNRRRYVWATFPLHYGNWFTALGIDNVCSPVLSWSVYTPLWYIVDETVYQRCNRQRQLSFFCLCWWLFAEGILLLGCLSVCVCVCVRSWSYTKTLWTRYVTKCLWEFHPIIYNLGTVGDKGEHVRFWGQKVKVTVRLNVVKNHKKYKLKIKNYKKCTVPMKAQRVTFCCWRPSSFVLFNTRQ